MFKIFVTMLWKTLLHYELSLCICAGSDSNNTASQEIPRISQNPKFHYRTHKRPPPVSILVQPNPVHIPTSHLLQIHPNIIHPSTLRSPQWSPSLRGKWWLIPQTAKNNAFTSSSISSVINSLTPKDHHSARTAPLTSKRCILYIYSTDIGTEYFKHGVYSPFFSLQNAVCFIILNFIYRMC